MLQVRSARPVDLPGIATVLQDAFGAKMSAIFGGHPQKVHKLLEAIYAGPVQRGYTGVLVAERDGRLVGTLVIEPMYHTAHENRALEALAVRELGLLRTLRAAFLLWLLSHTPGPGEAYISDLAVASDSQGEGIGQRLLEHAEVWARQNGRTRLTLWVADSNSRAIQLYEAAGFSTARTRSNWLMRLAFGIRRWRFMQKSVDGAPPA